jgi:hypothetical protein
VHHQLVTTVEVFLDSAARVEVLLAAPELDRRWAEMSAPVIRTLSRRERASESISPF